jgi:hypothetical protein
MPDTRIPFGAFGGDGGGQQQSGGGGMFGTLGQMMQIKEQQMVYQDRQRKAEADRRELEDDDAIRTTLPNYEKPEDAITALYGQGRATAAAKLGSSIFTEREKQTKAYDAQLESTGKRLTQATQLLQGIKKGDNVAYKAVRPAVIELVRPMYGDAVNDLLPTEYNEETMRAVIAAGTKRSEQIQAEHNAAQILLQAHREGAIANPYQPGGPLAQAGVDPGAKWSEAYLKIQDLHKQAAATVMPNAQNKQQWDGYLETFHNQGMSDDTARQIPQWNEANPKESLQAVALLGVSPKDRADDARQAARDAKVGEHEKVMETQGQARVDIARTRANTAAANAGTGGTTGRGRQLTETSRYNIRKERNKRNGVIEKEFDSNPDKHTEPVRQQYVDQKLQSENDARNEEGMAPLDVAAKQAVAANDRTAYDRVRDKYNAVTAGYRKLEDVVPWPPRTPAEIRSAIDKLAEDLKKEADPAKQVILRGKIAKLRTPSAQ